MCSKVTSSSLSVRPAYLVLFQIEEWYEQNYPFFVILGQDGVTYEPEDE